MDGNYPIPSHFETHTLHNIIPHSPNAKLSNLCVHMQHTVIPLNRKFSAYHWKWFQMHPLTCTGSQSCCSGRRPSCKHKPRREQREFLTLQLCEPQLVLFTLCKCWKSLQASLNSPLQFIMQSSSCIDIFLSSSFKKDCARCLPKTGINIALKPPNSQSQFKPSYTFPLLSSTNPRTP